MTFCHVDCLVDILNQFSKTLGSILKSARGFIRIRILEEIIKLKIIIVNS
jgi:hypothetical protein